MFGLDAPILGLISGAFGYWAAARDADRKHQLEVMQIAARVKRSNIAADIRAANAASNRDDSKWGRWVRRGLAVMVLATVCIGPYIAAWSGLTLYMREEWQSPEWVFGLIPAMHQFEFVPLDGVVVNLAIVLDLAYMIGGYYFGAAAGRGK